MKFQSKPTQIQIIEDDAIKAIDSKYVEPVHKSLQPGIEITKLHKVFLSLFLSSYLYIYTYIYIYIYIYIYLTIRICIIQVAHHVQYRLYYITQGIT